MTSSLTSSIVLFLAVFGVKTLVELVGREAESSLLIHRHHRASILTAVTLAACFPIGRSAIRDGSDVAAAAIVLAVYLTTFASSRRFERLKQESDECKAKPKQSSKLF